MRTVALPVVILAIVATVAITESRVRLPEPEGESGADSSAPAAPPRSTPASQPAPTAPAQPAAPQTPSPTPAEPNPNARPVTMLAAAKLPSALDRTPASLPPTLELVSLPHSPGAAPATKTITRTEALASVMASAEFQDTVSPLARLYLATFNRFPDYEGINYYTGQREEARPLAEIAQEFAGSREFGMLYGTLDNAEFVARMLSNVLGNPSQADVRAYWTGELDSGRMTRGQVIVDLAESGAFRERSAHQVFVSTAYTEILRRTPDPDGYNRWVARLRAGHPPNSVIDGLLVSR